MTNTAQSRERYDLIPGITAYRLARIVNLTTILISIAAAVVVSAFVLRTRWGGPGDSAHTVTPLLVTCGIALALIAGSTITVARRSKAETAAGYTTRTSGFSEFDQVDPRTGSVIRRAGSAVLTLRARDASAPPAGVALNTSSLELTRFPDGGGSSRGRLLLSLILGGFVLAAFFGGTLVVSASNPEGFGVVALSVLASIGIVVLIVWLTFVGTSAAVRRRIRNATVARPAASLVFQTQRTPELEDALDKTAFDSSNGGLPAKFAVTIGAEGIELWGGSISNGPRAAIPWSLVDHVHPGRLMVSNGQRSFAANTIHVFVAQDPLLDLPLPIFGVRGIGYAAPDRANLVLGAFRRHARVA